MLAKPKVTLIVSQRQLLITESCIIFEHKTRYKNSKGISKFEL